MLRRVVNQDFFIFPHLRKTGARLTFSTAAIKFSLTPCFSWGSGDLLIGQPFHPDISQWDEESGGFVV